MAEPNRHGSYEVHPISDPSDNRLALYRDLKDSALRRSAELAGGVFIVEGKLALEGVLASPYPLRSVLALEERLGVLDRLPLPDGVPVYVVGQTVMAAVTGFKVHRGLLAVAGRLPLPGPDELLARVTSPLLVVVEGVNDQENLGSIFRNAAAFGAGAVFLDPTCADPLFRRSVRVSLGHVFRVPFTRLAPWPTSLGLLANAGYSLLALTPSPEADTVDEVAGELLGRGGDRARGRDRHGAGDRARGRHRHGGGSRARGGDRHGRAGEGEDEGEGEAGPQGSGRGVALVVGAEGPGLTAATLGMCRRVRVPMAAGVDSLNVAAATAVVLHRFSRVG